MNQIKRGKELFAPTLGGGNCGNSGCPGCGEGSGAPGDMGGGSQGETLVVVRNQAKEPRKAKVLLLNDDYTSMEFVVRVLVDIFRKKPEEATTIMLAVHEKGKGECGVYPLEVAETKVNQVHSRARSEGFPLRCVIEYI